MFRRSPKAYRRPLGDVLRPAIGNAVCPWDVPCAGPDSGETEVRPIIIHRAILGTPYT